MSYKENLHTVNLNLQSILAKINSLVPNADASFKTCNITFGTTGASITKLIYSRVTDGVVNTVETTISVSSKTINDIVAGSVLYIRTNRAATASTSGQSPIVSDNTNFIYLAGAGSINIYG